MKKRLILLLVVAALAAGGYWWWQLHRAPVDSRHLTLYGNIDIREAQLAFNGNEHIRKILVQEGDRVKKGQLLAQLHTELLEAEVAQAEARLAAQQQELAKLLAGSRPEEIERAKAELASATARAKSTQDTYRRLKRLLEKKLAAPEDVEDAKSQADAAKGEELAARQTYKLLVEGPRKEDIAAARAELKAREAALALARQRLADASLYAPADGIIRNRILEPGDFATPQTPVLTLAFIDPVWARTYLPEPMLGRVELGMRAQILTDSYPGKRYDGWVGYVSPTAEFTPKSVETPDLRTRLVYQARIYACNPQGELRLGMPVTVRIDLQQPKPAVGTAPVDHCRP